MKILLFFCILSLTFYDLAAHQEKFDGTIMRNGTPVEKHCFRWKYLALRTEVSTIVPRNSMGCNFKVPGVSENIETTVF
jgi:hypothetical protein